MHPRFVLSVGNFFSAAHFFLIVYIITPYLAQYLPESQTGLVVSFGALLTLAFFPAMPRIVGRYGPRKLALILSALQAVTLLVIAASPSLPFLILAIGVACALSPMISYQLDLLLEATMKEEGATRKVRALFLTAGNIALIIAPLLIGFLMDGTDAYARVFLAAGLSLTPFIALLLVERLPEGVPPAWSHVGSSFWCLWGDRDLRSIGIGNAVLQFFYHLAPLYIPLYLHTVLGIGWDQLGWMFAVMLLPFVFFEYPAAWLADRLGSDRALLMTGFAVIGASFASIGFMTASTPLWLIAGVLFLTRFGAAIVESLVEGHFFRRVSERDANSIVLFRMLRPIAALAAPVLASVILFSGSYVALFLSTSIVIVISGLWSAYDLSERLPASSVREAEGAPAPQKHAFLEELAEERA